MRGAAQAQCVVAGRAAPVSTCAKAECNCRIAAQQRACGVALTLFALQAPRTSQHCHIQPACNRSAGTTPAAASGSHHHSRPRHLACTACQPCQAHLVAPRHARQPLPLHLVQPCRCHKLVHTQRRLRPAHRPDVLLAFLHHLCHRHVGGALRRPPALARQDARQHGRVLGVAAAAAGGAAVAAGGRIAVCACRCPGVRSAVCLGFARDEQAHGGHAEPLI